MTDVRFGEFEAVHDKLGKHLHVFGSCEIAGGGYSASLDPAQPGFNPMDLRLLISFTPTGESPERQALEYRQDWDDDGVQYTTVSFECDLAGVEPPAPVPVRDAE